MNSRSDPPYPDTYYSATAPLPACHPPLQGQARADVCVVGGGIAGCSAALALAERGYRVVLLEAQRLGWGASGRSGGQVIPGIALDQDQLEQRLGVADARRIWDISLAGLTLLRERLQTHRIACDWVDGQMSVAIKPPQWRALQRWHERLAADYGYHSTQLLEGERLHAALGSERYLGALLDSNSGHLHPLQYTLGLARAAQQCGVEIYEASCMTHYTERSSSGGGSGGSSGALRVHTAEGVVTCTYLLFAGNAWLGPTVPALARRLVPITAYMVATEPLGEARARSLIPSNAAVSDTNWVLDYFRRSSDHRLLFGGRLSYSGINLRAAAPATLRRMRKVFPQLAGIRIQYAWGCLVDLTASRTPHFGRLAPNVYFLQGFSGHGLALAGIAGVLLAEAIAGTAERFEVFARLPHRDFPGGPALRRPLLALAMLWYRLRDVL